MFWLDNYELGDVFDGTIFEGDKAIKCDIYEKNNNIHVDVDLPTGFKKDDVNIEIKNGYLTIVAAKSNEEEETEKNFIRKERISGKYERRFYLGNVLEDEAKAKYKNGIIQITIPKKEELPIKKIEIK